MIRVPVLEMAETAFRNEHAERVRFGDTDAAGIAYYANYYRWFEAGRAELLRAAGIPYAGLVQGGLFLPVVESWCRYAAAARYDEDLIVLTWLHEVRVATFVVGNQIRRGPQLLAEGGTRLACVDGNGHPTRLPAALAAFDPAALGR